MSGDLQALRMKEEWYQLCQDRKEWVVRCREGVDEVASCRKKKRVLQTGNPKREPLGEGASGGRRTSLDSRNYVGARCCQSMLAKG